MLYKLFVPAQAAGASTVHFDLFNITNQQTLNIIQVLPIVSGAVAVTGALAVDLFLTRTTAVGTSGTAATVNGTGLTTCTISAWSHEQPIDLTRVSARLAPSGGATAGAVLAQTSIFTEETNAGSYLQYDLLRGAGPIPVRYGTGIRVVQGAVASVGNIGFDVLFRLTER